MAGVQAQAALALPLNSVLAAMKPIQRSALASLFLASALLVTACGGGGGDDDDDAEEASVPPLAAAVALVDTDRIGVIRPEWGTNGDTNSDYSTTAALDGVSCGDSEAYHVHSHLSIFLDGTQLAVPAHVGLASGCHYSLHTHDLSGKIHVEHDKPATFTLGQWFAVWKQPFSKDNVAGLTGKPVVVYVEEAGKVTRYTEDFDDIEFGSHVQITIQVGSTLTQIPTYTWSGT